MGKRQWKCNNGWQKPSPGCKQPCKPPINRIAKRNALNDEEVDNAKTKIKNVRNVLIDVE